MTNELLSRPIVPPVREGHRRKFSENDKRRIVEEAAQPGANLSAVARRYGIAARVLFRWKQELAPLQARLAEHVFASRTLFADDTPIPVLDPGRGRTKTGRLWVYARDDRPWCGPDPPAAVYLYSPDRRAERPAAHLEHFKGVVQVDGYPGFERLPAAGYIQLAACWAHARRKFYEVRQIARDKQFENLDRACE